MTDTRSAPTSLRWDHLSTAVVPQWTALTNLLAEADGTEEFYEAEDLAEELDEAGMTPSTDTWAVWDGDRLVAFGQLRVGLNPDHEGRARSQFDGGVHPGWRGRGIGTALMDRMEERARELAAERLPDARTYFRLTGGLEGSDRRPFLADRGYEVARYFHLLTRPLPGSEVPPVDFSGVTLVTPGSEHEEATRLAHNEAFRDHWGSTDLGTERWHDVWTARSNRFEHSTLAVGPDGAVLSYALSGQWTPRELYVNLVGTVPSARGRGLAAATLGDAVAKAAASGAYDVVELDVDSASPTGADRLYERLGFVRTKTTATMQRDA